jgi:5-formyltetrahydrofolate cyclo-ligase
VTKQEIRKKYINLRSLLSAAEVNDLNKKVCSHFFSSVNLSSVNVIHIFLSIESKNEIDTWLIIEKLRREKKHIKISVPKVEGELLANFYLENDNQLKKNKWGILEPTSGEKTPTEKIDLIIVPLLAFDKKGNRVGYGKGFYDKFLKECRPDCKKIGLSFFEPVDEISDIDAHDVSLTQCITPEKIFSF